MKFIRPALLLIAVTVALSVSAQTEYRTCDTDIMWKKAVEANPAIIAKYKSNIDFFREYAGPDQTVKTSTANVQYVIPTVFHVIHNYGIEDISKAQILDAMDILNKTFQKLNDDTGDVIPLFQPIFANCQIEFRLATLDPSGNCTDGINRVQSTLTYDADDNVKSLIDWPSNQYLNIWVVANIASGAAGYSYYPGIPDDIDGIVIRHDYIGGIGTSNGSNYTERSLAHEVGHWLNLPHTWGSSNTPGDPSNCNIDDGIFDTPNTIGTNNFSCNTSQNTCGFIDNVQNYMDYSGCHKMFTNGQKSRMHAALNSAVGGRNNLHTGSNLLLTGTDDNAVSATCNPIADFSNKVVLICAGNQVNFKDVSWGGTLTSRQWTFNGGTPSTDTSANPAVHYNTPGIYDVTLQVSNATGSDQITRTALIEVLPDTGLISVPFSEGYENASVPGDWTVLNPDNNNAWTISTVAASAGSKSIRLNNQSGNASGSIDAVISPVYNFSNASGVVLTFDLAFARKNASDASNLKVSASNDCGQGWQIRYNKSGSLLETAPLSISAFTPTALQWRTETVSLSSGIFGGKPAIRLKFEYTNDLGNNIYIDNINVTGTVTTLEENNVTGLYIYPNPADKFIHAVFNLNTEHDITFTILDVTGRVISEETRTISSGEQDITLPVDLTTGVYLLKITADNQIYTSKFISK